MMLLDKKHINEPLNLSEHTDIPGVLNYKEDISTNSFIYKSPEGLHVSRAGTTSGPMSAEIHFTPRDVISNSSVDNILYIPEYRRDLFRKKSVVDLIISLNNLVDFTNDNPDAVVSRISYMCGHTNKEMAKFFQKRLGLETTPAIHPVTNKLSYYFEVSLEDLKKGIEEMKSESRFVSELLSRKSD